MTHPCLSVNVTALRDLDWYPCVAECEFTDAAGKLYKLVEKAIYVVPDVAAGDLGTITHFPYPGYVRCKILAQWHDAKARELVRISTEEPDHIESIEGIFEFEVFAAQLSEEAS